jgi:hypothetical protein
MRHLDPCACALACKKIWFNAYSTKNCCHVKATSEPDSHGESPYAYGE